MGDRELGQQGVQRRFARVALRFDHLEDRANILLDGKPAKDRRLLRQVADAATGAAVHRKIGDVLPVEADRSGISGDEPSDDIKTGGLAGPVRSEQPDHLAALHRHVDAAQHRPTLKALSQSLPLQPTTGWRTPAHRAIIGDKPRPALVGGGGAQRLFRRVHGLGPLLEAGFAAAAGPPDAAALTSWRTNRPSTRGAGAPGLAATVIMWLTFVLRSRTAYWPLMTSCPRAIVTFPSNVTMPVSAL